MRIYSVHGNVEVHGERMEVEAVVIAPTKWQARKLINKHDEGALTANHIGSANEGDVARIVMLTEKLKGRLDDMRFYRLVW